MKNRALRLLSMETTLFKQEMKRINTRLNFWLQRSASLFRFISTLAMSQENIFSVAGPHFLTSVDWSNSFHRRSVAASLAQGAYIIEHDRQHNAEGVEPVGPPWWEFFNFRLLEVLIDDHDVSYFGAIFEFKSPYPHYMNHSVQGPPQYVVAFRGTIPDARNREEDFKLDLHVIFNDLQNSSRFHGGIEKAREIVYRAGQGNVWLVGHSLGSSIALIIGRDMAKTMGIHLETYLFNPPFISPPIGRIKNERLQFGLRFANSVITAGIVAMTNTGHSTNEEEKDTFVVLSTWVPYLFLNPMDHISCEYIGYFSHREKMESFGAGKIGHLATQHSIGSIASGARSGMDSDAIHLIPSAYLTINTSQSSGFRAAHGVNQWWKHDLELNYNLYHYK